MAYETDGRPRSSATPWIVGIAAIVFAIVAAFAFGLVDIDQTRELEAPKIAVEGGQAPEFDVDTAKVEVGTKDTAIEVPKVEVGTTKTDVKVPTVAVDKAH
ncbi:hypothetical protein ACFB49_27260 [Sphingomonas sp. DBB INV C78]|uniref:hypothetical protein n=1 Tax=Sphingomonas sp. DBB INV C78 TaxID=3349434 RepID=UPI0036D27161